ncbi:MAG: hemerythrin domain-containing protein [Myxococcota bacterium]
MGFKALPSDAIAMLGASYRRQEAQLDACERAIDSLSAGHRSQKDLDTVIEFLAFMRKQAARHLADEEVSVLPRLSAHEQFRELIHDILSDHRKHEIALRELEAMAESWAGQPPGKRSARSFATRLAAFKDDYQRHIDRKDDELIPAIRRYLSTAELSAIAAEMLIRRGDGGGRRWGRGPRRTKKRRRS